ncbi:MAG TPA: phosphoketolase family protein, partial [Candidatus Eisenbacteria bacterium]
LNGWKIANPTIFHTMTDEELLSLFKGYGWEPRIVDASPDIHEAMAATLEWAHERIRAIQRDARDGRPAARPAWPALLLRTPKGWTGPREIDGTAVEGSFRSHQVPAKDLRESPPHFAIVERWLRSYRPEELFDREGRPAPDLLALCPKGDRRMALNRHGFGGRVRRPLVQPPLAELAVPVAVRGATEVSAMEVLGEYLRRVIERNEPERNFRIVCPDELESNRLGAVLGATDRQYCWPIPEHSEHTSRDGRVLEMLSEHMCQGWLQGYLLTGRHGLFPCYEAFIPIVDGMMNQYAKFLKSSLEVPWRSPISSLNYVATSEAWRQDHNGYSHQGPGFLNNLLTKKGHTYHIFLPPDANSLLVTLDGCLASTDRINLIVQGKQPMPQWLTLEEARDHVRVGASVWAWASTFEGEDPDLVLACSGDNLTLETMAAAQILRERAPDWRIRVVNVVNLQVLGIPQKYPHGLDEDRFQRLFPLGVPVLFNFHGYTAAIKQLVWERPGNDRFDVNGYREEGTTTTPFDMQVRNRTSRFHVVVQAAQKMARRRPEAAAHAESLILEHERRIEEHGAYIRAHGADLPEIAGFRWTP